MMILVSTAICERVFVKKKVNLTRSKTGSFSKNPSTGNVIFL
jgi:hypothetical protein